MTLSLIFLSGIIIFTILLLSLSASLIEDTTLASQFDIEFVQCNIIQFSSTGTKGFTHSLYILLSDSLTSILHSDKLLVLISYVLMYSSPFTNSMPNRPASTTTINRADPTPYYNFFSFSSDSVVLFKSRQMATTGAKYALGVSFTPLMKPWKNSFIVFS